MGGRPVVRTEAWPCWMVMPMSLACDAMVSPRVGRPPMHETVSAFKHMVQTMSKRFQLVKWVAVAYLEQSIQTDENNRRGMYLWTQSHNRMYVSKIS